MRSSNDSEAKLRSSLIRLAHNHPEFRANLLPLVASSHIGAMDLDVYRRVNANRFNDPAQWPKALEDYILHNPLPIGDRWDIVKMSGGEFKVEAVQSNMFLHAKTYYYDDGDIVSVIGKTWGGKSVKRQLPVDKKLIPGLIALLNRVKTAAIAIDPQQAGHAVEVVARALATRLGGTVKFIRTIDDGSLLGAYSGALVVIPGLPHFQMREDGKSYISVHFDHNAVRFSFQYTPPNHLAYIGREIRFLGVSGRGVRDATQKALKSVQKLVRLLTPVIEQETQRRESNRREVLTLKNELLDLPTNTTKGLGDINAAYLEQSSLRNKILQSISKLYGSSISDIEAEITGPYARAVYEYVGGNRSLQRQVYQEFVSKKYNAGPNLD